MDIFFNDIGKKDFACQTNQKCNTIFIINCYGSSSKILKYAGTIEYLMNTNLKKNIQ